MCARYRRFAMRVAVCCSVLQCVLLCDDTSVCGMWRHGLHVCFALASRTSASRALMHHNTTQHTATYCNILRHTATHIAQRTAIQCNTDLQWHHRVCVRLADISRAYALQHTVTHCNTLQHIALHTATYYNTLQHRREYFSEIHTATHCNTLQHTATHIATYYNTLQHRLAMTTQAVRSFRRYLSNTCTATH